MQWRKLRGKKTFQAGWCKHIRIKHFSMQMDNGEWQIHHTLFNGDQHIHHVFFNGKRLIHHVFFNGKWLIHLIFFSGGWLIHHYIYHEFKIDYFVVWDLWGKHFSGKVSFWHWSNIPTWFQCMCVFDVHWNIYEMTTHVDKLNILWTVL